jgi:hypothetical protein
MSTKETFFYLFAGLAMLCGFCAGSLVLGLFALLTYEAWNEGKGLLSMNKTIAFLPAALILFIMTAVYTVLANLTQPNR